MPGAGKKVDDKDLSKLQRRQPVQSRAEKTKLKIVEGAIAILGENGIAAFSIRQVAKLAGVSVGSVYEYFPSRQALLFWVAEQRLADRLVAFDSVLTPENLKKSLPELIDLYLYALRGADLYSRLDLEIRVAEERDPKLAEYTEKYKHELTERYISVWRHYGSTLPTEQLNLIARYSHELDLASMKLQLSASEPDQLSIRFITQQLAYVLANLALQSPSENL